jgi:hypothetical protein
MKSFHLYTLLIQRTVLNWSSDVTHNEQLLLISFSVEKLNQFYSQEPINNRLCHFTCTNNMYQQLRGSYRPSKTGHLHVRRWLRLVSYIVRQGRKNMGTKLIKTPIGNNRLEQQRGHGRITRRYTLGNFIVNPLMPDDL